jgi:hypothetical protein
LTECHRIVALDATSDEGPASIAALTATLEQNEGLAIISGPLPPPETVERPPVMPT